MSTAGATRSQTTTFLKLRSGFKGRPGSVSFSEAGQNAAGKRQEKTGFLAGGENGSTSEVVPEWVATVERVKQIVEEVSRRMKSLKELHQKLKKPQFGKNEADDEETINIQTQQIKTLFKESEKLVKALGGPEDKFHNQEDKLRRNVQTALVNQLTQLTTQFKKDQRAYMQSMKGLEDRAKSLSSTWNDDDDDEDLTAEDKEKIAQIEEKLYDPGFTEEQIQSMIQNERMIIQRDKELSAMVKSITELNDMFKDLSVLVIEQGTLLDRIDYNIEQTAEYVESAHENLVAAEESQKGSRMIICIILLVVVGVAVIGIILLKVLLNFVIKVPFLNF